MEKTLRTGCVVVFVLIGAAAHGQRPAPIADLVSRPILPDGISNLPVNLNAELGYFFKDDDGTDVVHLIGRFSLTLGEHSGQELRAREAVVWIANRDFDGRPYRHFEVLLWRDAEVREIGDTVTSGPALFVTLNSFGDVNTAVDGVTFQSSAESQVYQQGNAIRMAVAGGTRVGMDEDVPLRVYDASGLSPASEKDAPRPVLYFRSEGDIEGPIPHGDQQAITVIGGVYLSRGVPGAGDYLEIRADAVAVFLPASEQVQIGSAPTAGLGGERTEAPPDREDDAKQRTRRGSVERQALSAGFGDVDVDAVYLEGDVIMMQGPNMVRASRLYYDFANEKALILDAVVRTNLVERGIPLYMRAAEIRQLSATRFAATEAVLTTSEFHTPHYHIGADKVELNDLTPAEPSGRQVGVRAGTFDIRNATLNMGGRPVAHWPRIRGNIDTSETAIRKVRAGYRDEFGVTLETEWQLFNLLGLETPDGFDGRLHLDYFSDRGPGIGVDADYVRERYFGLMKSYVMTDDGEDDLGGNRDHIPTPDTRGRFLLRHRQYLEDDWQVSLEVSYISDKNFLEEYFENEFDNDKDQETLLYLKKQRDNWAFTSLLQTRILDWLTQTERYPDQAFFLIGQPLGEKATWYSENRAGIVRYRTGEQSFKEFLLEGRQQASGGVLRADSRQEVTLPLDLGPVRLVPFGTARGTVWDDSPEDGGQSRAFGTLGVRGSMYFSRLYPEARSTLFDIDGLRHIIKPELVAWTSGTNVDSSELFPFDETVERISDADGVMLGLRQRWQTKRGEGENRRIVDFLTLDLEAGFFNDASGEAVTNGFTSFSRPEDSIVRNYVNSSVIWRLNDRTALLSELNYDTNDGEIDVLHVSYAVERSPRFSYLVAYRFIEEENSNLLGLDMNYRLNEKHTLALRELFDLARGETLEFTIAVIRKFPRWYGALAFDLDEAEDDFGVSFSIWPEGLPQAALGSRRFTGLANTTRVLKY